MNILLLSSNSLANNDDRAQYIKDTFNELKGETGGEAKLKPTSFSFQITTETIVNKLIKELDNSASVS